MLANFYIRVAISACQILTSQALFIWGYVTSNKANIVVKSLKMSYCVVKITNKQQCLLSKSLPVDSDLKNITSNLLTMKQEVNNFLTNMIENDNDANAIVEESAESESDEGKLIT